MTIESAGGVAFRDLASTNEELLGKLGDLYEQCVDEPSWRGVLTVEKGELKVARVWDDGTFGGYDRETDVWGWWNGTADRAIAHGLVAGTIRLLFQGRGEPVRTVIIPGAVA